MAAGELELAAKVFEISSGEFSCVIPAAVFGKRSLVSKSSKHVPSQNFSAFCFVGEAGRAENNLNLLRVISLKFVEFATYVRIFRPKQNFER